MRCLGSLNFIPSARVEDFKKNNIIAADVKIVLRITFFKIIFIFALRFKVNFKFENNGGACRLQFVFRFS